MAVGACFLPSSAISNRSLLVPCRPECGPARDRPVVVGRVSGGVFVRFPTTVEVRSGQALAPRAFSNHGRGSARPGLAPRAFSNHGRVPERPGPRTFVRFPTTADIRTSPGPRTPHVFQPQPTSAPVRSSPPRSSSAAARHRHPVRLPITVESRAAPTGAPARFPTTAEFQGSPLPAPVRFPTTAEFRGSHPRHPVRFPTTAEFRGSPSPAPRTFSNHSRHPHQPSAGEVRTTPGLTRSCIRQHWLPKSGRSLAGGALWQPRWPLRRARDLGARIHGRDHDQIPATQPRSPVVEHEPAPATSARSRRSRIEGNPAPHHNQDHAPARRLEPATQSSPAPAEEVSDRPGGRTR